MSVPGASLSIRGSLSEEGFCPGVGGLCPGSLSRGRGSLSRGKIDVTLTWGMRL